MVVFVITSPNASTGGFESTLGKASLMTALGIETQLKNPLKKNIETTKDLREKEAAFFKIVKLVFFILHTYLYYNYLFERTT